MKNETRFSLLILAFIMLLSALLYAYITPDGIEWTQGGITLTGDSPHGAYICAQWLDSLGGHPVNEGHLADMLAGILPVGDCWQ